MAATLKIAKMSVSDKLQAMEELWDSLRRKESDVPSPEWHKAELSKRLAKGSFIDFDSVKRRLQGKAK